MRWVYSNPDHQPVFRREVRREIISYAWIPTKAAVTAMGIAARAADSATLAQVRQPVLLLHGRRDEVTWPDAACRAVEKMASTTKRTVLLDNSNHILFWDYEREAITQEVLNFLKESL
jgi:esterase/lipase